MKQKLLILAILCLGANFSQGQSKDSTKTATRPTAAEVAAKTGTGNPGSAIGLNIATNGFGLQFAQNINPAKTLTVRVGGMYMPIGLTNYEYNFDGQILVINGDIKLGAVQALVDFHPFKNAFKLTGGVAYMLTDITATAVVRDSVKQGDIMISPEEVGKIDVGIKVGPICPYIGIGFGRAVPKTRFSFNFEIGGYYINQPNISFKATGMLEPSSANEKVLQDNMSGYNWLPMMNFGFNFKIGK
jgi:hypothetical protein